MAVLKNHDNFGLEFVVGIYLTNILGYIIGWHNMWFLHWYG